MSFYEVPPTTVADVYVEIPEELRCIGEMNEWTRHFPVGFDSVFLEGPITDDEGNLFAVDVPYGRILKIDGNKVVSEFV